MYVHCVVLSLCSLTCNHLHNVTDRLQVATLQPVTYVYNLISGTCFKPLNPEYECA